MIEVLIIVVVLGLTAIVLASLGFARFVMKLEAPPAVVPVPVRLGNAVSARVAAWLEHADALEQEGRHLELNGQPHAAHAHYVLAEEARERADDANRGGER